MSVANYQYSEEGFFDDAPPHVMEAIDDFDRSLQRHHAWLPGALVHAGFILLLLAVSRTGFFLFEWLLVIAWACVSLPLKNMMGDPVRNATIALATRPTLHCLDRLLMAYDMKNEETHLSASSGLMDLLPILTEVDAGRITQGQRASLRDLARCHCPELVLSLLSAWSVFGDVQDRIVVEGLIGHRDRLYYPATKDPEIVKEALKCLAAIDARLERERISGTLLRAVSEDQLGHQMYLRPTGQRPSEEPEMLLRSPDEQNVP